MSKAEKWVRRIVMAAFVVVAMVITGFSTYAITKKYIAPTEVVKPIPIVPAELTPYQKEKEFFDELYASNQLWFIDWHGHIISNNGVESMFTVGTDQQWHHFFYLEREYAEGVMNPKTFSLYGSVDLTITQQPDEIYVEPDWDSIINQSKTADLTGVYSAIAGSGGVLGLLMIWTIKTTHKNAVAIAKLEGANNVTKN